MDVGRIQGLQHFFALGLHFEAGGECPVVFHSLYCFSLGRPCLRTTSDSWREFSAAKTTTTLDY